MKLTDEKKQVSEKMDEVHWPKVELKLGTREKKAEMQAEPDQGGLRGSNQHLLDPNGMERNFGSQSKPYIVLTVPF